MATAIILIVVLLTMAYFHLKCSVMSAFSTLMSGVIASVLALNYFEILADLFISNGYAVQWAHCGSFILLFILSFAIVRTLADLLVGANVDFGVLVKNTLNVVLGFLTGLILAGHILIAVGMSPLGQNWAYHRFPPDQSVSLQNPSKPILNPDGFVTGLFSRLSRGSLRSDKSFAVLGADFVNRNHLNRLALKDSVLIVCSKKALTVPPKEKKPVRLMELPEVGQVTVVRAQITAKDISKGGARNEMGNITFCLSQVRMITKPTEKAGNLAGKGEVLLPIGLLENGKLTRKDLSETITYTRENFRADETVWVDFVFQYRGLGSELTGVLLEFKQNALAKLPPPVQSSDEIEQALSGQIQEGENSTEETPNL